MHIRHTLVVALATATLALPCAAQQRAGLMGDLMKDVNDVQSKLVSLAQAMPATSYQWRPGTGVRSVGEVFLHVAGDNYLIPGLATGIAPAASTGISLTDFASMTKFEGRKLTPDETVVALKASFTNVLDAMSSTSDAKLDDTVSFFGQQMTMRQVWILTATHLHEHLGQAIAYARSNGVTPPWSRSGG